MTDFSFFKSKKVLVMGLGTAGRGPGIVKFLIDNGAVVTVTDLKSANELKPSILKIKNLPIKYRLGKHSAADFAAADFIVKNPAVPINSTWLDAPRKQKTPIITDLMLFFLGLSEKVKVIGITGTKGKTTTASLIYQFLNTKFKTHLAGVPKTSYLEILKKIKSGDFVVLELSSFDLEGLAQIRRSPNISVITNLHSDHLNRYGSFKNYVAVKKNIFLFQNKNDVLVLNANNAASKKLASEAKGKVRLFSSTKRSPSLKRIIFLSPWARQYEENILAAYNVAKIFKIPDRKIKKVITGQKNAFGHLEKVGTKKNITFINDTCATDPVATSHDIRALHKIYPKKKIVLITGGEDKDMDFKELAPGLKHIKNAVILSGSAERKIEKELRKAKILMKKISGERHILKKAISEALSFANAGAGESIILFSPATASFNMFQNEFDRGRKFISALYKKFPELKHEK